MKLPFVLQTLDPKPWAECSASKPFPNKSRLNGTCLCSGHAGVIVIIVIMIIIVIVIVIVRVRVRVTVLVLVLVPVAVVVIEIVMVKK